MQGARRIITQSQNAPAARSAVCRCDPARRATIRAVPDAREPTVTIVLGGGALAAWLAGAATSRSRCSRSGRTTTRAHRRARRGSRERDCATARTSAPGVDAARAGTQCLPLFRRTAAAASAVGAATRTRRSTGRCKAGSAGAAVVAASPKILDPKARSASRSSPATGSCTWRGSAIS